MDVVRESITKGVNEDIQDCDYDAQKQTSGVKATGWRVTKSSGDISTGFNVQDKLAENIGDLNI